MPTYVTRQTFESELPFTHHDFHQIESDAQWNTVLDRALDAAETLIESWLDTVFERTTVTETLHGEDATRDGEDLPLPHRPVIDVTSVDVEDEDAITVSTDLQVTETHIELTDDAPFSTWPDERWNVTVEWDYGHEGAPDPVREGIIRLARNAVEQVKTDGLTNESLPDGWSGSYRPPREVKAEVYGMIQQYEAPSYYGGAQVV